MDFSLGPAAEALRADLRSFLDTNHPGRPPRSQTDRIAWFREWSNLLVDAGWAGPSWPKEWGGMDLGLEEQLVYHEEMSLAGAPSIRSFSSAQLVGPTIIVHGTLEQKRRFLPPMLRATELWCQGFSEPEAGSDLASLRTTAVRDGDQYVVKGQKVWTSRGPFADWMFALVRTGPAESRQHGITYLLFDMHAPGVEVRPLKDMSGVRHFAEVFFDDLRVPVSQRIGEENGGWHIARTTLGHERSTSFIASDIRYRAIVDQLIALARELGRAEDPTVRQELARMEASVRLMRLNALRVLSRVMGGDDPGAAASVGRLFNSVFEQRLHELAVDILGPSGQLGTDEPTSVQRGRWTWGMLRTRASTIGTGTAEIQRNIIAEQVLGLPREPNAAAVGAGGG